MGVVKTKRATGKKVKPKLIDRRKKIFCDDKKKKKPQRRKIVKQGGQSIRQTAIVINNNLQAIGGNVAQAGAVAQTAQNQLQKKKKPQKVLKNVLKAPNNPSSTQQKVDVSGGGEGVTRVLVNGEEVSAEYGGDKVKFDKRKDGIKISGKVVVVNILKTKGDIISKAAFPPPFSSTPTPEASVNEEGAKASVE